MNKEIEKWERQDGIQFLRRIGLCANQAVLDFGCRVGHYTIPAAKIVSKNGTVYAVDKEQKALSELQQKVKAHNLNNVKIMRTSGQVDLDFKR